MKVAVLGARGYIGSYLCTYLWTMNYEVIPVTRETVDLTSYSEVNRWMDKNAPGVVINAAISGGGLGVNDQNYQQATENLSIFFNFYNQGQDFRYINIGSGAEFDRSQNIDNFTEHTILYSCPRDSYGYSKNIISRAVLEKFNFMTLRLFGCFSRNEPNFRLFPKFLSGKLDCIQDRYFDYFTLEDFARVVEFFCRKNIDIIHNDINCVYDKKLKLSEILSTLKYYKNLDIPIYIDGRQHNNYTGNSMRMRAVRYHSDFPQLDGLEKGLQLYE